jgi:ABC-type spermidine/putrescine transport system permease subunit II
MGTQMRGRWLLDILTTLPLLFPGIVMGLAILRRLRRALDRDFGFHRGCLLSLCAPLRYTADLTRVVEDSNGARNRAADMQFARKLVKSCPD